MNERERHRMGMWPGVDELSSDAERGVGARPTAARPGIMVGLREGAWPECLFGHPSSDVRLDQTAAAGSGAPAGPAEPLTSPAWAAARSALLRPDDPWLTQSSQRPEAGTMLEVDIFCDGFRTSGWVNTGQFDRLSDWLNMQSGFIAVRRDGPAPSADGATAPDGTAGNASEAAGVRWVRLSSVVLVADREGAGTQQGWHPAPVVQKERVRVSIVTPGYRLDGDLHVHSDGSLSEYLSVPEPRFLPVTDVSIRSRFDATEAARFRFALVNREHLVLVADER
jgi:hypothetical protein